MAATASSDPVTSDELSSDPTRASRQSQHSHRQSYRHSHLRKHSHAIHLSYLKRSLKDCLPQALQDCCTLRPQDPIEFIARWLYQYMDCELYFFEKAIFARQLHLMRLELARERARRLANIRTLRKQINQVKFLLSCDINDLERLWKKMAADVIRREQKEAQQTRDAAALGGNDELDTLTAASMDDKKKRKKSRRREGEEGSSDGSSSFDERGGRRGRKGVLEMTSSEELAMRLEEATSSEFARIMAEELGHKKPGQGLLSVKRDRLKSGRKSFDRSKIDSHQESDLSSGRRSLSGAMRCTWYLLDACELMCFHPILGVIRSRRPRMAPPVDDPHHWRYHKFNCNVYLDHEIYNVCDPTGMEEFDKEDETLGANSETSDEVDDTLSDVSNF